MSLTFKHFSVIPILQKQSVTLMKNKFYLQIRSNLTACSNISISICIYLELRLRDQLHQETNFKGNARSAIKQSHEYSLNLICHSHTHTHTHTHGHWTTSPSPPSLALAVSCSAVSLSSALTSWVPALVGRREVLTIVFSCLVTKQLCHTSLPA